MKLLTVIFSLLATAAFFIAIYLFFERSKQQKKKYNDTTIVIVAIFLLSACCYIIAFSIDVTNDLIDGFAQFHENKNQGSYAELIGGIMGTVMAFIGIIAASLAFYAQFQANRQVQNQFHIQDKKDYRQNFENTFFNLIAIHHQIVNSMDFDASLIVKHQEKFENYIKRNAKFSEINDDINQNQSFKARDVFSFSQKILYNLLEEDIYYIQHNKEHSAEIKKAQQTDMVKLGNMFELQGFIDSFKTDTIKLNNVKITSKFSAIYNLVYFQINSDFGHYFRSLYRIIKLIDEKEFDENAIENFKVKYSYTSIIRSQLSDDEIKWLFFNCLSDKGMKKFKPLLEKYSFLKIIYKNDKVYKFYLPLYHKTAFDKPEKNEIPEHLIKFPSKV